VTTAEVVGTAEAVYACHSEMRDEGAGRALVATGFFRIRNLDQLRGAN
jgi:hypothetical protein